MQAIKNPEFPSWLEKRYSLLLDKLGDREFNREQAIEVLTELKDSEDTVAVVLSELRKLGLVKTRLDVTDNRRRWYKLEKLKDSWDKLFDSSEKLTRSDIEGLLKKAADLIRTRVDYKFILILLFLKRISDKWELEYEKAYREALADGLSEEEAREEAKSSVYHEFDLPEEFLWDNIRRDVNRLPERLSQALKVIAERNPELRDVIDRADFIQFTTSVENFEILRQLVELFSSKKLHRVSPDIMGDAYEWILMYFAPQKAKEGEVYTPREVIDLLIRMLDPKPGEKVYDPACGSGGMLISAFNYVEEKYGEEGVKKLFLYGQEANQTTYAFCKMNAYIHDIRDVDVRMGDTLIYPKFKDGDALDSFHVVVANPPWNQDGYDENVLKKGELWKQRYGFGFPPRQSADWAWIQHMLASADDEKGRVGIVIDNGCLFRGGKEKTIRSRVVDKDWVECVILLPEKLFYNTGAPGAIIVFNKNKPEGRKEKVLFINASQEYEKHPDVRKLNILTEKNIEKIVEIYKTFGEKDGISRVVSLDEIRENDYNLNVTLYVFPEEEVEEIDVNLEWKELKEIEKEIEKVEREISAFLRSLR